MDCIFCKIVNKEIPGYVLGESDLALAFLDVNPLSKGHTVVIPKAHGETVLDIGDDDLSGVFILVKEVTQKLQDVLNPDGFTIGINMREVAGQAVAHLHVHVVPRWKGDGGGNIHSIVKNPPEESVEKVYELFT